MTKHRPKYTIVQMLKQVPHQSGDRSWIINMAFVAGVVGVPTSNFSASRGIGRTNIERSTTMPLQFTML